MAVQFNRPEPARPASDWREVRRLRRGVTEPELRFEPFENLHEAAIAARRFINPIPFEWSGGVEQ